MGTRVALLTSELKFIGILYYDPEEFFGCCPAVAFLAAALALAIFCFPFFKVRFRCAAFCCAGGS